MRGKYLTNDQRERLAEVVARDWEDRSADNGWRDPAWNGITWTGVNNMTDAELLNAAGYDVAKELAPSDEVIELLISQQYP